MNRNLAKNLEQLGLTEKESLVYLSLLEIGRGSVAGISLKTGIKRPTCYLIIDDLIKKNLVSKALVGKKALYSPEHPTKIVKDIENNLILAKNIISGLQEVMTKPSDRPALRMLHGLKGIQSFYNEMLEDKNNIYYIASIKDVVESVGKDFLDEWIKKRIATGIKTFSIRTKATDIQTELYKADDVNLRNVAYAEESFDPSFMIFIYGKKVAFVGKTAESIGFIVSSVNLSKTMKSMFDVVWSSSTEKEFYNKKPNI